MIRARPFQQSDAEESEGVNVLPPDPANGNAMPEPSVSDERASPREDRGISRWMWLLLAYLSLGLGVLGLLLPLLPTVPFVLLAAFAASRGSRRLHRRLLTHPRFGPMIRNWQKHGAVSRHAKYLAVASMSVSAALMLLLMPNTLMALPGIACMLVIGCWLWLRPEPPA